MKWIVLLVLVVACKGDERSGGLRRSDDEPAAAKVDPACAAKAQELEAWLAQLEREKETLELNFFWTPVVLDRAPERVARAVDYAVISPRSVAVWDASESNHVGDNIGVGADAAKIDARLATVAGMKGAQAGDDVLRIDVDAAAPWSEVAGLVGGAARAGYTRVVFAFEATSKVARPAGVPATIDDEKIVAESGKRLDELRSVCDWGYGAAGAAARLVRCGCKVDLDEIRAASWKAEKWHQAHTRVGVEVAIARDGASIELPAATPWSEAHAKLLDVKGAVALVVTAG